MKLDAAQTDRAIGVLTGTACGDALGAGYEFGSAPFTGTPGMIGGGLGNFAPGEWTDDTAQAMAIAEVAATGADLREPTSLDAIAGGFDRWWRGGPPDVGVMTRQVFAALPPGPSAEQMSAEAASLHDRTGMTAGNGSLMRTAPVALAHLDDPAALAEAASAVATLTHADPLGAEACVLWCLGLRSAVLTGTLPDLRDGLLYVPEDRRGFWRDVIDRAEAGEPSEFTGNGFVVTALQAAWSAITHTPVPDDDPAAGSYACQHFADSLATAIGIGHDTDTVAAIAGAMLGARWGVSAIPWRWRRLLHGWPGADAETLQRLAVLTVNGGPAEAGWPTCDRVDYSGFSGFGSRAVHPGDPGVHLSGAELLDDLPEEITAVVSLTRVGRRQVPERSLSATFRLIDTAGADNPNLDFVLADAAETVRTLRAEGHTVLLHCAAAQSRTPTVATVYARLLGQDPHRALQEIRMVLPHAAPNPSFRAAVARLG